MRIAWVSPVPPARSGIADYTAELLPHVAALAEVDVFFEGGEAVDPDLATRFRCRPVGELPDHASKYDVVVYHVGNAREFHDEIRRTLLRVPGVAVLHEYGLHHLVREGTLIRGDLAAYQEELRYAAGESGRRAGEDARRLPGRVQADRFPLFERIVDASAAVFVHTHFARKRILASRPRAHVDVLPMPTDVDALRPLGPRERAEARATLGIPETAFVLGTFGFVTKEKHLEPALDALARFRRHRPDALFKIVGQVAPKYDLAGAVEKTGAQGVELVGRVPLETLHRYMSVIDVGLNLRYPTGGETSATLFRLLAFGIPTIVSRLGSFAELPPGTCFPVDVDIHEPAVLEALFLALARDPELRAAASREARRSACERNALPHVAGLYVARLEDVLLRRTLPPKAVPPLAPWERPNVPVELLERLGSAAADLGIGEDEPLLEALAARMVEVDLDRGR